VEAGAKDWASLRVMEEGMGRFGRCCEVLESVCKNVKVEAGRNLVNDKGAGGGGGRGLGKFATLSVKIGKFVSDVLGGVAKVHGMREVVVKGVNDGGGGYKVGGKAGGKEKAKAKEKAKPKGKDKENKKRKQKAAAEGEGGGGAGGAQEATVNVMTVKRKKRTIVADSDDDEEEEREQEGDASPPTSKAAAQERPDDWEQVDEQVLQGQSDREDDDEDEDSDDAFGVEGTF
jgi:hypothetical protein